MFQSCKENWKQVIHHQRRNQQNSSTKKRKSDPKPKFQKWTNWGKYQSCHKQFQRPLWTFQPYFLAAWTFSPTSPSKWICKRIFKEQKFRWTFSEILTKENAEKLYPWWWGEPLWALTGRLPWDWKAKWNVVRQTHLIIVTKMAKRQKRFKQKTGWWLPHAIIFEKEDQDDDEFEIHKRIDGF